MNEYTDTLKTIRGRILDLATEAKEGHIPSSFSVLEILYTIYKFKSSEDVFFLSKGHASLGFYVILNHFGIITREQLLSFCKYDSPLGGHPHRNEKLGIMNSSGSLGHGLPMAVGYALAKKIKGEEGKVICLVGDGECNEGSVWEAATMASHLKLDNLVCIVDSNHSQERAMPSEELYNKFLHFGWAVGWEDDVDGHDIERLNDEIFSTYIEPAVVIAHTKKGKGVKEMELHHQRWHHRYPTPKELKNFKLEISYEGIQPEMLV